MSRKPYNPGPRPHQDPNFWKQRMEDSQQNNADSSNNGDSIPGYSTELNAPKHGPEDPADPNSSNYNRWARLNRGMTKSAPQVAAAGKFLKWATTPSPYAPMTWLENNSAGGIYPQGMKPSLYPYQTSKYQIQSTNKKPSRGGNTGIAATQGDTLGVNSLREGIETDALRESPYGTTPTFQQGSRTTPSQRLHRDPLFEVNTKAPGSILDPHTNRLGTTWGDQHSQTVSGLGSQSTNQNPESIRAPKSDQ